MLKDFGIIRNILGGNFTIGFYQRPMKYCVNLANSKLTCLFI